MAFGKVNDGRKILSEVIAAADYDWEMGIEWLTTAIPVVAASATVEEPMGIPVVYNGTNFERYVAQDIDAASAYTAADGSTFKVAIIVGDHAGVGHNQEDVTLDTTAITLTALYKGKASVMYSGVDFGAANAGDIAEFKTAMATADVRIAPEAATVVPTYNA